MEIAVLGIDLGKNSCSVVGLDGTGQVVMRRRMQRDSVIKFASNLTPCVVAMEACCGAHHLGRIVRDHGHQVRLMSPEYVRPYVKAQKNDDRDAEAIAEAATRPTMRFVELKSAEQLDMQSLHRVRDRLVGERTALMNQLRAVLMERGITVPQGRRRLEQHLAAMLGGDEVRLSPRVRLLIEDMRAEWGALDNRIEAFDDEFAAQAKTDGCPPLGEHPRDRRAERNRPGGSGRQCRHVCAWARPCGLARLGTAPDDDGRQTTSAGDQQTGQ
jgi:transposase